MRLRVSYRPALQTTKWSHAADGRFGKTSDGEGDNIQRLAFARTADAHQGNWRFFDITTQAVGLPGHFLDFPDLAAGANMLSMTTNAFEGDASPAMSTPARCASSLGTRSRVR